MEKKPLLGILGGLGPMSSVYFYELITAHTKAQRDQEHIDIIPALPHRIEQIILSEKARKAPCRI